MAKLPYRVLYNQDNSNLFFVTAEPLTPEHVDRMVDEVADGGADALLLCPNAQRTSYPSAVWQPVWDGYRPGDPSFWGGRGHQIAAREHMVTQMRRLAERCDYVERALSRCAQRRIAPGISIRMNDMHDAPWPDSHLHSASTGSTASGTCAGRRGATGDRSVWTTPTARCATTSWR